MKNPDDRRRSARPLRAAGRELLCALLALTLLPSIGAGSAAFGAAEGRAEAPAAPAPDSDRPAPATDAPADEQPSGELPPTDESADGAQPPAPAAPADDADDERAVAPDADEPADDAADAAAAPQAEPRATGDTLYVSASGSDATGDGTHERPFATLQAAVQKGSGSAAFTVAVMGNLAAATTAVVGAKNVVVTTDPTQSAPAVVTGSTAATLFTVNTGSLTFSNIVLDGASVAADHRVVEATGTNSQVTLSSGTTVRNWYSSGTAGAFRVNANGAALTMQAGSTIQGCRLVTSGAQAGGAAVSILANRAPGVTTSPSSSNRASFTMQGGSSIVDCDTQLTANGTLSGGGAIHAADADVSIQAGASVRSSDLAYRTSAGVLFDPTGTRQGGGGLFANNCKVDIAGTVDACNVASSVNVGTGNFFAGGGGVFLYDYGCTTNRAVDCRATVSGTISNCSAIAGGGVFYWSEADGYDQGDDLWTGPNNAPLTSAAQVVDKVYDTFTLSGSIEGCSTIDEGTQRSISLGSYGDFERFGIGGGAVCGAYTGLIVLADGSSITGCSTYSEGGAVSNYGTSVFCLDGSPDLSGGPLVSGCTSGKIAGGLSMGAASHVESVRVDGCTAGAFGGGMYLYSGSTTMYNCSVTNCSADGYGGGIMQDVVHDLFWYGGTVTGNRAGAGGGGVALYGFAGGSANAPRGLVFNYPVTANGGYTNPGYYKSAILAGKIVAPSIVRGNVQGTAGAASDVWTNSYYPSSRISVSGSFVDGSKIGVRVSDGLASLNAAGAPFGYVYQSSANLAPFANDVDPTLVAAGSGTRLAWASGFVVDYRANVPTGGTLAGSAPFDGADGMANAYPRSGGAATLLDQGSMAVDGYTFKGWASSPTATTAQYQPGASLSYDAALDPLKNGHLVLYAVWEAPPRVCQIIRDTNGDGVPDAFFQSYTTLYDAFGAAQSNDRIEMLRDAPIVDFAAASKPADGGVALAAGVTGVALTTAPLVQPVPGASGWLGSVPSTGSLAATLTRTASGSVASWFSVAGGCTVTNVVVDGGCTVRQAQDGTGVVASHALFEVSGAASSLTLGAGTVLRNACNASGPGGAVLASGGAALRMAVGASIVGCTAADGGGVTVEAASFVQGGGSIASNASGRFGGGVYAGPQATVTLSGLAEVRANTAKRTGGGVYVDPAARLVMTGGSVVNNAASAENDDGGAYAGAYVGGVALGAYEGASPLVTLGGAALVSGNVGRPARGSSTDAPKASDLEAARSGSSYAIAVDASGLAATASVGITSADPTLLAAGAQFASRAGSTPAEGLQLFFNDADAGLASVAGAGDAVVWRGLHADVTFTKVGADQRTGDTVKLGGAKFNLYRYVGSVALGPLTINGGSIDLASTTSSQWAPVIAADGTVGAPGVASNVPYVFESSSSAETLGQVKLTQLTPASWYMLVEAGAPDGYQQPAGQWAFQAVELSGSGGYGIDATTLLARKDDGGLPPPAFSTSVTVDGAVERGMFLTNVARFDLPFAGMPATWPYAGGLAGIALIAIAGALHRTRRATL